ncbi:MAG: pyruvate ferredoxin oxidoreductase, partial [Planctomycetota bacterium]
GGPLFNEIRSFSSAGSSAGAGCPQLINYVYGLGGRDINATEIESIFGELVKIKKSGKPGELYRYIGLRE